jgi:hypothetical protein
VQLSYIDSITAYVDSDATSALATQCCMHALERAERLHVACMRSSSSCALYNISRHEASHLCMLGKFVSLVHIHYDNNTYTCT